MSVKDREELKGFFELGDRPTQTHFGHLIDSFVHINEGDDDTGQILNTLKISGSETYTSGSEVLQLGLVVSGAILPGASNAFDLGSPDNSWNQVFSHTIHVSGNIIPNVPNGSFTSSFSLGTPEAAWKDLYVSEDSIKFIKKSGSNESEELARITIDTSSGLMQFKGLTDHKDLELRQTQFGKSNIKGATINDGGGASSTDVRFSMQSKDTGINGGAFVFRPEFADLGYLGNDFVTNNFTFKGTGSAAFLLDADNGNRGDAKFKIWAHTAIPGLGTELFTVEESKISKFHGTDGVLIVEGKVSGSTATFNDGCCI